MHSAAFKTAAGGLKKPSSVLPEGLVQGTFRLLHSPLFGRANPPAPAAAAAALSAQEKIEPIPTISATIETDQNKANNEAEARQKTSDVVLQIEPNAEISNTEILPPPCSPNVQDTEVVDVDPEPRPFVRFNLRRSLSLNDMPHLHILHGETSGAHNNQQGNVQHQPNHPNANPYPNERYSFDQGQAANVLMPSGVAGGNGGSGGGNMLYMSPKLSKSWFGGVFECFRPVMAMIGPKGYKDGKPNSWEIPFESLLNLKFLGSGAQGAVYVGKLSMLAFRLAIQ